MRIAILSALETTADGRLCGALPYLGVSVFAHQCDVAVALGAKRVICLTQGHEPTILKAQHRLEAQGIDFHIVANSLSMAGLITADDDLVLLADSVLTDAKCIPGKLAEGRGIVSVSGEFGTMAQLERIDADRFWAGVLVVRGDIAAQLADLPKDSDVASLLLRLALQARTPIIALEIEQSRALLKVSNADALAKREKQTFAGAMPKRPWTGIGQALALKLVLALGPSALGRGHRIALGFAALGCVLSLAFSAMNVVLPALFVLCLVAFSLSVLDALDKLQFRLHSSSELTLKLFYFSILMDVAIALSIALLHRFESALPSLLLGPIAIMALRIAAARAAELQKPAIEALFADRISLIVILAVSVSLGYGLLTAGAIAILALGFVLFWGARQSIRQT